MAGFLKLAVIAPIAILLLVVFQQAGISQRTPPVAFADTGIFPGDVNCSGATDSIDALQILSFAAGLTTTASDCLQQYGNVNCDASINAIDSMLVLRYAADLPIDLTQACPAIGGPPTAEALTRALNAATTVSDADWVLKLIYQQLGLTVYTKDGQLVQAGTQAAADDFYFYDFESDLIARNYLGRQLFGLDTAGLFLNEAGVPNAGGQPWTEADVLSTLTAKVTAARGDDSMFAWRLIDQLGLSRDEPLDLTKPGLDPATTYLDSIQTFLVLNEMTLGLSASAVSAEDVSVAAAPGARTEAMQDYSLLAQAYDFVSGVIPHTHWRQGVDEGADRNVGLTLWFQPGLKVAQGVTAGPLQGVAIPAAGAVSGAVVDWFPDATLLRNGEMVHLPQSLTTDSAGYTYDTFIPRRECPTAVGTLVFEVGRIDVVARVQVTSVFPPHSPLGVVSKDHNIPIEVSHHTGSSTLATGAVSPAALGVATDSPPPCAYEGTASSTQVIGETLETYTITASNLRFELIAYGSVSLYQLVSGNVTVQVSGGHTCTYSGGSTTLEPQDNGDHQFFGFIDVDLQTSQYSGTGHLEDRTNPVLYSCPNGYTVMDAYSVDWLRTTTYLGPPDRSFTPGDALEGSFDWTDAVAGDQSHWQWSLHPAECVPSPEPVCQ